MVKIIRMGETQSTKNFGTNKPNQHTDDQRQPDLRQWKSMSNEYPVLTDIEKHSAIHQSLSHRHSDRVAQGNLRSISSNVVNPTAIKSSNIHFFEHHKGRSHSRQRGSSESSELCFYCCLIYTILAIIGLITPLVVILTKRSSTTTMATALLSTITTSQSITTVSPTTTTLTTTSLNLTSGNWLINGDAETGACEAGGGVTHPTGWNYNGNVTQVYYNNSNPLIMWNDPGPSDRGRCFFYGQTSVNTSMWQTVNMTGSINAFYIDNQTISFNFSAWIGGYLTQDDNAQASLTFLDQANQPVGSSITLGPVLASQRASITSLILQQASGLVPIGARSFIVIVTFIKVLGTYSDSDIDDIAVGLYH